MSRRASWAKAGPPSGTDGSVSVSAVRASASASTSSHVVDGPELPLRPPGPPDGFEGRLQVLGGELLGRLLGLPHLDDAPTAARARAGDVRDPARGRFLQAEMPTDPVV